MYADNEYNAGFWKLSVLNDGVGEKLRKKYSLIDHVWLQFFEASATFSDSVKQYELYVNSRYGTVTIVLSGYQGPNIKIMKRWSFVIVFDEIIKKDTFLILQITNAFSIYWEVLSKEDSVVQEGDTLTHRIPENSF